MVKLFADKNMKVGKVNPKLYSSFVEHVGRCVYTGIYEPGHPTADENGFRGDVLELVKQLQVQMVRYPGGNFLSGYDWKDGIGPKGKRPTRPDIAWQTTEPNQFGTDEFMDWCEKTGIEPMMAVNMGTGTPKDAAELVEYCNHSGGTYFSELRKANGHEKPYAVETWCIGNEMDGPWQICGLDAEDYAKKALQAARMMKGIDPGLKLVACGSSSAEMVTYPEWDRIVLDHLYDEVDYISMHRYYWDEGNRNDFFASYYDMDAFIKTIRAAADYVKAKHRSKKVMGISFDEWNVWYQNAQGKANWAAKPKILEDVYSLKDALVFAGMMTTLLNNCDRVQIACLAQLVNAIGPIFTKERGEAIKQTTYFPFEMFSVFGRGDVMNAIVTCDAFESKFGDVPYVAASVVENTVQNEISVFLINYSDSVMPYEMELRSFGGLKPLDAVVMDGTDLEARNTFDTPEAVKPRKGNLPAMKKEIAGGSLPACSFTMLRFSKELS